MKKSKSFFDDDLLIDENLFNDFPIDEIISWPQLEIWCAINNIETNFDFFKGILFGITTFEKFYDIIIDAIENSNVLDNFLNEIQTIEIIEKLYSNHGKYFKGVVFWENFMKKTSLKKYQFEYFTSSIENKHKYKIFNAIFKKNQKVFLLFYDKYKLFLHQNDIDFEHWLLNECKILSMTNEKFKDIFQALKFEAKQQNKLTMYLN